MIDQYLKERSIQMFTSTGVLNQSELRSRCEVKWENYSMKLQIESRVLGDLVINHILPAAKRYQTILLQNVQGVKQVFSASEAEKLSEQDILLIRSIENHTSAITAKVNNMNKERARANHIDNQRERAITFHDYVVPLMEEIRQHVDDLEMVIDDQLWPLPKYRELLFIH
jgi:glutamine synthetase